MGYTLFSAGVEVRIVGGTFVGIEGVVVSPTETHQTANVELQGESMFLPVTVSTIMDGHSINLRVPPELLERIAAL